MQHTDRDHLGLLYDIGELSALIRESTDIPNLLERTVTTISEHLKAEVCSIYLYDQETRELVLKATKGLNPETVEKVRIAFGTGLVGATIERLEPIIAGDAPLDPRFKYFAEAPEDAFRSFLSVPLQRGEIRIGVLVVQHSAPDYFAAADVRMLRAVAAQLAGILENVRLLISLRKREGVSEPALMSDPAFIKGQAASPGFAYGSAVVFDRSHVRLLETEDAPLATEEDFHHAVAATARQLDELQERFTERLPESASLIFSAHLMMLKDAQFTQRIVTKIHSGTAVSQAVREVARDYIHLFGESLHHLPELQRRINALTFEEASAYAARLLAEASLAGTQAVIRSRVRPGEKQAAAPSDIFPGGRS
jgi:phosphotransferase system enzyme I (PtsP)